MITGEIKSKIDKIWTDLWAGGVTNPLHVIEQLTYLMFIRSLDENDIRIEEFENSGVKVNKKRMFPQTDAGQEMRWSRFKNREAREVFELIGTKVFPFIKSLGDDPKLLGDDSKSAFSKYIQDAIFIIPTPQVLEKVVTGLDGLYRHDLAGLDMQGDLYEYMLDKLATAGQNGQFRTPKHIRDLMVHLVEPGPDDRICDPACGTAGFLISAAEFIRKKHEAKMSDKQWAFFDSEAFSGFDMDRTMLRISAMNLMLHSITRPNVLYRDSVSKSNEISNRFNVILANPPFSGVVDKEGISDDLKAICNTGKTELLFVAVFLRMLRVGGRCACIVPDGVLFGSSNAHKALRKEIVEKHFLRAVISMPSGVFKPYAGVSTAILVFTKTGDGGTDKVWFYNMKSDGFSLDDKRTPNQHSDIPDIKKRFHNLKAEADRVRTDPSFLVDKADIVANDYDLSINKYKKTEYVAESYPPPSEILADVAELEKKITAGVAELRKLITHNG